MYFGLIVPAYGMSMSESSLTSWSSVDKRRVRLLRPDDHQELWLLRYVFEWVVEGSSSLIFSQPSRLSCIRLHPGQLPSSTP